MNKSGNKSILETSIFAVKIIMCILLVFNVFVFIYFGLIFKNDVPIGDGVRCISDWTVIDSEGNEHKTDRYFVAETGKDKNYTLYAMLPDDIKENEYFYFDTRKDIEVYIDGELRNDFIEDRDVCVPGGSIKKFYFMTPVNEDDCGKEIRIIMKSPIKDEQIIPDSFISTHYGGFKYLMNKDGLSFFLALIVLIFSLVAFVVSVVLRYFYKMKIDMMYGALGIFIIASWLITDSNIFPFLIGSFHVEGILNYMFCLLIPFAPAAYLDSVQCGRYKKSISVIMILSAVNAVTWPVLHFTGIIPIYNVRMAVNSILAVMSVAVIVILIIDAVKGNFGKYRFTFIGFFGFLLCCIFELLMLLLIKSPNDSVSMVIGLGVLLTFVVVQQVDDIRIINMEKQYAMDISEAKTRFLASMSHEIRTPINAILGMNEMILRENTNEVIGEYSRSIRSSGKMLLMLVNDVLDFSKIEAGKMEINETTFLMSAMLYDVISHVKERADEKSIKLEIEIKNEIPDEVTSDEFRIRQILINLMNNAVKYTEKGSVTLILDGRFTGDDDFEIEFIVKDTGKGIKEEDQAHLFEAFTRVDAKSNANIEGTGLGLAIVKSIVDSMNGTIELKSEYAVGSEFRVTLPVKYIGKELLSDDFMEKRADYDAVIEGCDYIAPDANILAVDDNQSNLTIVKLFLKRTGIVPDLCNSGNRAIELCREKKYDLILLDHMMPKPDGIETLHIIKNDEKSLNRETKAIVFTANAVAGSRRMYLNEGFDDYLTKPIESKVFEKMVKSLLPKDKIINPLTDNNSAKTPDISGGMSPTKKKLMAVKGLDYDMLLKYCDGDEEFLEEMISGVVAGCEERVNRMRESLREKNIKAYEIDAHTLKSTMATLGLAELSERARKHEFAAKDNDVEFIYKDAHDFIEEYIAVCEKLR